MRRTTSCAGRALSSPAPARDQPRRSLLRARAAAVERHCEARTRVRSDCSSCSMHATSHRASASVMNDRSRHARPRNRTAAASSFARSALAIKTSSRAASSRSTWLRSEAAVRAASRSPPAIARRSFVSGDPWAVTNTCSQRVDRNATGSIAVKPQRSLASSPMPPARSRLGHERPSPAAGRRVARPCRRRCGCHRRYRCPRPRRRDYPRGHERRPETGLVPRRRVPERGRPVARRRDARG